VLPEHRLAAEGRILAAFTEARARTTADAGDSGCLLSRFRPRRSAHAIVAVLLLVLALVGMHGAIAETAAFAPSIGRMQARYWVDSTGAASVEAAEAAFRAGQGRPASPDQIMPLGPRQPVWFQLQLPAAPKPARAVLTLSFPGTDHADLYRRDNGAWYVQHSGDALPVDDWPLRYLTPAFALTLQPGEPAAAYLRIEHSQSMRVLWNLQGESSFLQEVELWHLGLGAYAGFLVMVVLVSIFNCWSWRDPIHLYYAVHAVLVGLSIMSLSGLGGAWLWPAAPWWNDKAPFLLPAAALAWAGLFARELVAERGTRFMSRLLLAHVAVTVAMMVAFVVIGREHLFRAPSIYFLPGLALLLWVLTWYTLRRPSVGLWIMAGIVVLVVGSLFPLMHNLGWLPASFLTYQGTQLGAAVEIPLTLIGLFFRSRERRANRERLEQMATTDPLTGLANHRVLERRLEQLLRRARRDPALGAVYRVHVANLGDITAEHGREAAEAALMRAAECVAKEAREGDLVAREPGSDIVLVLGGHLAQPAAIAMGRDIIARGLKYSVRLPPGVTLKLRVAAAAAPLPPSDPSGLLQTLARLLLDMENDEHGRWLRFLGGPDMSNWHRSSSSVPRSSELPSGLPPPTAEELATLGSRPRRSSPSTTIEH
jgi:diguanylate cyclase (GGDEF)-like protein